jgi:hypothetical protein
VFIEQEKQTVELGFNVILPNGDNHFSPRLTSPLLDKIQPPPVYFLALALINVQPFVYFRLIGRGLSILERQSYGTIYRHVHLLA